MVFSPTNCVGDQCALNKEWYWLSNNGAIIDLTTLHLNANNKKMRFFFKSTTRWWRSFKKLDHFTNGQTFWITRHKVVKLTGAGSMVISLAFLYGMTVSGMKISAVLSIKLSVKSTEMLYLQLVRVTTSSSIFVRYKNDILVTCNNLTVSDLKFYILCSL